MSGTRLLRHRQAFARIAVLFIATAYAFALVSCVSGPPPSPLQIAGIQSKTIAVAPLNLVIALPTKLKSSTAMVSSALFANLQAHGKTVHGVNFRKGRALWIESTRAVRESDGAETFENAARVFTQKLGEEVEFDAFIIPALYVQNAKIDSSSARWDSANQRIEFVGRSKWEIETPPLTTIEAASVLIYVLDPAGNVIHTKRTGLELIQHMEIHKESRKGHDKRTWTLTDDDPALEDETRIRAAIAHALSPFLDKTVSRVEKGAEKLRVSELTVRSDRS